MPGLLLGTPRYDYASAEAAAAAYGEARHRATRAMVLGFSTSFWPALLCLPLFGVLSQSRDDADMLRLARLFAPFYLTAALVSLVLFVTQLALAVHIWTMRRPIPDADADAWYAATRENVVREGRFVLSAAAVGTVALGGGVGLGVWAIDALARTRVTWDLPVVLTLPGVSVLVIDIAIGLRHLYRPDTSLAAPRGAATTRWPLRAYLLFAFGVLSIMVGSLAALFGDAIPGVRRSMVVEDGVSYPGIEFPVVVARVTALPFAAGVVAATGWVLVAWAVRTARSRGAVLLAGAVATTWLGASVEPIAERGLQWLWYGAVPGLLITLGVLVLLWRWRPPGNEATVEHRLVG